MEEQEASMKDQNVYMCCNLISSDTEVEEQEALIQFFGTGAKSSN